jgi:hypothetical protein
MPSPDWCWRTDCRTRSATPPRDLQFRSHPPVECFSVACGRPNVGDGQATAWFEDSPGFGDRASAIGRPYLEVPGGRHDGTMATGNGGQKIFLWPALELVVVMTAGNYNTQSHANALAINYILPRPNAGQ